VTAAGAEGRLEVGFSRNGEATLYVIGLGAVRGAPLEVAVLPGGTVAVSQGGRELRRFEGLGPEAAERLRAAGTAAVCDAAGKLPEVFAASVR
jgi:hypothetical protein